VKAPPRWAIPWDYVGSAVGGRRQRALFDKVERFCLFVGHARSGQTVVGSLMNSHPDVVIAHELDVLRYLALGFTRDQIYELALRRDRQFTEDAGSKTKMGYVFAVPGQWQGRFRALRVIGDKKAGASARALRSRPQLLHRLAATAGVPLRVIHVTRNPFDNIAAIARRSGKDLSASADSYFRRCETIAGLSLPDDGEIVHMRHEDFVADPIVELGELCRFLGVESTEAWARDCARQVFSSPRQARREASWSPELLARVERGIADFRFLKGYHFED
jgi:hypothetical protein